MESTEEKPSKCSNFGAKMKSFGAWIWDREKKQFAGRDGLEWAYVGLFYFVFYAALAGFFAAMLAIFMQIVDRKIPRYSLDESVMARKGINPGMGYRPQPDVSRNLMKYQTDMVTGDNGWGLYHNTLLNYLDEYTVNATTRAADYVDCSTGRYADRAQRLQAFSDGKSCFFDPSTMAGPGMPCVEAKHFMYPIGQPCVAVKLNRLFNWEPQAYTNSSVPDDIRSYWTQNGKDNIYVTCNGENAVDIDNLYDIEYYSPLNDPRVGGIPSYYYPYKNQAGYHQPFVFIHFKSVAPSVLINIECRAWAANIDYDRPTLRGSMHFELMID